MVGGVLVCGVQVQGDCMTQTLCRLSGCRPLSTPESHSLRQQPVVRLRPWHPVLLECQQIFYYLLAAIENFIILVIFCFYLQRELDSYNF
jgi:hypothetical protein